MPIDPFWPLEFRNKIPLNRGDGIGALRREHSTSLAIGSIWLRHFFMGTSKLSTKRVQALWVRPF